MFLTIKKRFWPLWLTAILFFIFILSNNSFAATRLSSISVDVPTRIALDSKGNIYVTEPSKNCLLVFDRHGNLIRSLNGLKSPIGVAIDSAGRIYIGNDGTDSVDVYDANFSFSHKLGEGDGEVKTPNSIVVDSSGVIYVSDSKAHMIKVYNPDGSWTFSIGEWGSGDGQFNVPLGLAIDEATSELYVTDLGIFNDPVNGLTAGARVQVFSLDGTFKRSFGEYGTGDGKLIRPVGIAIDNDGKVYVTDSYQAVVHVFDSNGNPVATIYDLNNPMKTPLGIAIGKDDRIFIASLNTSTIEVYGLSDYTFLTVSPTDLSFTAYAETNPPSQLINIGNSGTGTLNWSIVSETPWITVSQTAGSIGPSGTTTVSIGVNTQGLEVGTYNGSLTVNSSGASETVDVTLEVLPAPVLHVSPLSLSFKAQQGGSQPASQTISIELIGDSLGGLTWTATSNTPWISTINPSSGNSDVTTISSVYVNTSNLAAGKHDDGCITITAPGATGSPSIVSVTLDLISAGNINVTTNLEAASFTITGPATYKGSGLSWGVENAPAGEYTISFDPIIGYKKPDDQGFLVESGKVASITGYYKDLRVTKKIIAGLGSGVSSNPAEVKVLNADGTLAGADFIAFSLKYGAHTAAGDINGDGIEDIIVGAGEGSANPARVKGFYADGTAVPGLDFIALSTLYGANVAVADLDGDGKAEIIAGAGTGKGNRSNVKVYSYDTARQRVVDTGINLTSDSSKYGVHVAAGDIDGDGYNEIITGPGPDTTSLPIVKVWKVDSQVMGMWTVKEVLSLNAYTSNKGVAVAGGDLNGDGIDEIITGEGEGVGVRMDSKIKVFRGDGTPYGLSFTEKNIPGGVNIAAGDINGDGISEIVVGAGSYKTNPARVKVYDANGSLMSTFIPFAQMGGVNVGLGKLD